MTTSRANLLLLLAALVWGGSNVAQKTILEHIGPLTAVGLKCLIAGLIITPYFLSDLRAPCLKLPLLRGSGAVTVVAFTGGVTALQYAYAATSVINASFLVHTATIMTPMVAWLVTGVRPAVIVWIAAALTLAGVRLMGGDSLTGLGWGDALCFASAGFFAFWAVYLGIFVQASGSPGVVSAAQFLIGGGICLAAGLLTEPLLIEGLVAAAPELFVLGVLSTGLGYLLQAVAQQYTSASTAAIIVSAEAVFGALGGFLILGETLHLSACAGVGLLGIAFLLVHLPLFQRHSPLLPIAGLESKVEQTL
jgi:drug/metabolite transporter (DMT)-like permease